MEKERKKMCPHCEGVVPYSSVDCPFCGFDLTQAMWQQSGADLDERSSLAGFYQPPYVANSRESFAIPNTSDEQFQAEDRQDVREPEQIQEPESVKSQALTILLLSIGSYLFALGLLVFFFSENGRLVLEWKSKYCLLYTLLGLPFLYLGWLRLNN